MATFGNTSLGPSAHIGIGNSKHVSLATTGDSGQVDSLVSNVYRGSSGSTPMMGLIYADSGGLPGALLAKTDEVLVTSTSPTPTTFPFSGVQKITVAAATNYWIGIIGGPSSPSVGIIRTGVTANAHKINFDPYSNGPSDPFGAIGTSTSGPIDAYVNYTTTGFYSIAASLVGSSGGTADVDVEVDVGAALAGDATLTATLNTQVTINEIDRKNYLYKIYDPDTDEFLGIWPDVVTEFKYSQEVNNAGSAVDVELARNSDTLFVNLDDLLAEDDQILTTESSINLSVNIDSSNAIGPDSTVDLNLNVEIYVFYGRQDTLTTESDLDITTEAGVEIIADVGAINGRKIFTGYISKYVSRYGAQENTLVSIFSHGAELDQYVVEDGVDTTVPFNSYDPADIVRDGLDMFNAAGGLVSYSASTISTTGTVVSYTFRVNTYLELIKKSLELAPSDYFFYLDMGTNEIYFQSRPTTPQHYFILGKHIEELKLEKYIEDLVNVVYFSGGEVSPGVNLFQKYEDTDSITTYRRGLARISDNRVTLSESADIIAESAIERGKDPRYRSNVTISSADFDIEEIRLGDLIAFRNFGNFVDAVTMQVVRIDYTPDNVALQLDTLLPSVPKRLQDIYRNLDDVNTKDNPDAPT